MKTIGKYLTLAILAYLMIRCDSGTETPPPAPVVVSGDIKVIPTSIKAGETVTISWSNLVNVKTLIINTAPVSISDGSKIYTPTTTTTFSINLIGTNDKVVEKSAVVNVVEPPIVVPTKRDTIINLLCSGSFRRVKNEWKINGVWDELTMSDLEARRLLVFTKDGKSKDYDPLGIGLTFIGDYKISSDLAYLTDGGRENEFFVNEKQLIFIYWSSGLDPKTKLWDEKHTQSKTTYDRVK